MVRFIQVLNETSVNPRMERRAVPSFSIGEIWLSPQHVVSIKEAQGYKKLLEEGHLAGNLHSNHQFTAVIVNSGNISQTHIVIGSPETVAERLNYNPTRLLKG
tara:strand:- start:108 stop:416 length:309 start_codon:yes stop_codon:yes gene_type:complete